MTRVPPLMLSVFPVRLGSEPGGETPYNGLYREVPPERGTAFSLRYERVGVSLV